MRCWALMHVDDLTTTHNYHNHHPNCSGRRRGRLVRAVLRNTCVLAPWDLVWAAYSPAGRPPISALGSRPVRNGNLYNDMQTRKNNYNKAGRNNATCYELSESLPGDGRSHSKTERPVPSVNVREAMTSENQISDSVGDGNKGELVNANAEPRTLPPLATACTTTFIAAVAGHVWIRGSATRCREGCREGEASVSSSSGIGDKLCSSSTGLFASRSVGTGAADICAFRHKLRV